MTNEQILKKAGISKKEYDAIHQWLRYNYGRPEKCSHCGIYGTKKHRWNIDWALIRGEIHARNIKKYIGLCMSCHQKYDNPMPEWCEVKNCDNPHFSKGKCKKHYHREYFRTKLAVGKWIHAYD